MVRAKHKRLLVIVLGLIAIGLVVFALYARYHQSKTVATPASTNSQSDTFYPKADEPPAPPPPASTTPTPPPTTPSTTPQTSSSGLVSVTSPTAKAMVTSGTTVSGTAQVYQGKLYWRVKGEKSGQLGSGIFQLTGDASQAQAFSFPLTFTNQAVAGDSGEVQVYSLNASDGSEINQVDIAVGF